ncbi:O(6)-methylguanine-induced apoptosis 2 [Genypterus blacodes]|uniref:O(6)-methylguanine-induced apoptosis 2 n=1 Tax=Genypterus blacodes TaxID=154954 RepID=UPI003F75B5E8
MAKIFRGLNESYEVASSLQNKNQTVQTSNQHKKGFSSQAKRFPSQLCPNENPGPGTYECTSTAELSSPSFSKKGTTGLASETARVPRNTQRRWIPGPNVYNLQGSFINKYDFNTGVSRVFRSPVAVQLDRPKNMTPAPNQYDVCFSGTERKPSMAGTSAFLSKTGRNSLSPNKYMPSPCHYEVNDDLIQKDPKAASSPFKSKTPRIPAPLQNHFPGPGAYSPHQIPVPVKRTILPRGHYLAIATPALIVPKDPPFPGPGQYEVLKRYSSTKHPVPTAAFASRTQRILQDPQDSLGPGPGFYEPRVQAKQSFFYSDTKIWVPT